MSKQVVIVCLCLACLLNPVLAQTMESTVATAESIVTSGEVSSYNYWQEFDLTFWQTAPFAVLWCNLLERQLCTTLAIAGGPHWEVIMGVATLVSAANAAVTANRVDKLQHEK
jgi:hypothetical protein